MKRKNFLIAGTAAAALGASRPALADIGNPFAQQLTIGVSLPLTGDQARAGEQVANGVRAALEETNRTQGPLGRAYGMRTFDDQGELASAIQNVDFATADPSIIAMIGNLGGPITKATLPQYANFQMPLVVPASTYDGITELGYRNVWRLPTKDSVEGRLFARLVESRKLKLALGVTQDGDYGYDVATSFVAGGRQSHFNADAYVFPIVKPDFTLAAKTIMSKSPDFIYLCGKTKDMGPLIPALRAAGFTGSFGASDGFFNEGTLAYADSLGDALISSSLPPLDRAPAIFQELSDFRSRYGQIGALGAFGYAAAQVIVQAERRFGAVDRLAMLTALRTGGSYNTLVGSLSFSPTGDPIDPNLYFYSIAGGKFKFSKSARPSGFVL